MYYPTLLLLFVPLLSLQYRITPPPHYPSLYYPSIYLSLILLTISPLISLNFSFPGPLSVIPLLCCNSTRILHSILILILFLVHLYTISLFFIISILSLPPMVSYITVYILLSSLSLLSLSLFIPL
jgi:hypothetical protein